MEKCLTRPILSFNWGLIRGSGGLGKGKWVNMRKKVGNQSIYNFLFRKSSRIIIVSWQNRV